MSNGLPDFPKTLPAQTVVGNPAATAQVASAIPYANFFPLFGNATLLATGIAGTNTITGTTASAPALASNQIVFFIPLNTNTGATTFNRDSLGAKNILANGAALVGGELRASVPALIFYDGTQYNLFSSNFTQTVIDSIVGSLTLKGAGTTALVITGANSVFSGTVTATELLISTAVGKIVPGATSISLRNNADSSDNLKITDAGNVTIRGTLTGAASSMLSPITSSLSGDVALNNTGTYFDGPSVAQGTSGTWFVSGVVTCQSGAAANAFHAKLWDGVSIVSSGRADSAAGSGVVALTLSGFLSSPAGNLKISVKDATATDGNIKFNLTGNSKDSTITAIRIA